MDSKNYLSNIKTSSNNSKMEKLSVLLLVMSSCLQNKILMPISIPNLLKKQVKLNSILVNMKMYLKLTKMERTFYSADWQVLKFQRRKQPFKSTSVERDLNQDSKNTKLNLNKKKMNNLLMRKKKTNNKKEKISRMKKRNNKNKKNNNKLHQQKRTQNQTKTTIKNHKNNLKK